MSNGSPGKAFNTLAKACWDATAQQRARFYAFICIYVLAYSLDLLTPLAMGYTLGIFIEKGFSDEAYQQALMGIGAFMALRLVHTFLHHYGRYLQSTVSYSARMLTLSKIYGALLSFPLSWHAKHHSGENLSKLHRSAGAIDSCIGTYIWQIIEGLVKVVLVGGALFALDFWVAINVLGVSTITILVMIMFNARLTSRYRQNNVFWNKINRICIDYLFNVVTVKTLALERPAREYLEAQKEEGLRYTKQISKYTELKWGTTAMGYGLVISSSLLIYFYDHRNLNQAIEVAQVYALISYLDKIFQAIGSFTGYYGGIIESATAYEDGASILFESPVQAEQPRASRLIPGWKTLKIRKLNFSYNAGEQSALVNMSLDIHENDKIALVGPSGGGKSTLLKVLGGLLIPESCTIQVDTGEELSVSDIASASLLVPQEPEIFSETFRYNLTVGEKFSDELLSYFISLGRLDAVLAKLPQREDTDLAEKGLNLSVGEKQRLAMVRGLLRAGSRQILLLDEPTSSLDPRTEKEIFYNLLGHFSDRVIVTACHRLNLVPLFDKVVFIRNGVIEEVGSFAELLTRKGAFAAAWEDYERRGPQEEEEVLRAL